MATSSSQVLLISPVALADTVDMHSKLNSRLINKAEAVCPTGRYFFICLQPSPADDRPPAHRQRHSRATGLSTTQALFKIYYYYYYIIIRFLF